MKILLYAFIRLLTWRIINLSLIIRELAGPCDVLDFVAFLIRFIGLSLFIVSSLLCPSFAWGKGEYLRGRETDFILSSYCGRKVTSVFFFNG